MRFAGKELDPETGFENFGARYYRQTWGRFTQVDPLHVGAALADPQQWNRYAYARNNPLRFVDPTGMYVWGDGFRISVDQCMYGGVYPNCLPPLSTKGVYDASGGWTPGGMTPNDGRDECYGKNDYGDAYFPDYWCQSTVPGSETSYSPEPATQQPTTPGNPTTPDPTQPDPPNPTDPDPPDSCDNICQMAKGVDGRTRGISMLTTPVCGEATFKDRFQFAFNATNSVLRAPGIPPALNLTLGVGRQLRAEVGLPSLADVVSTMSPLGIRNGAFGVALRGALAGFASTAISSALAMEAGIAVGAAIDAATTVPCR